LKLHASSVHAHRTCAREALRITHLTRYVMSLNRVLSDYPTIWPKKRLGVKKNELYDLLQDPDSK
jgi:hypothetical protein